MVEHWERGEMVKITWLDSRGADGWILAEQYEPGLCTVETIGFVIVADEETITVVGSITQEKEIHLHAPITIPRRNMVEVVSLECRNEVG